MIEVIQAFENGREIEFVRIKSSICGWKTIYNPVWNFADTKYRIKETVQDLAAEYIRETTPPMTTLSNTVYRMIEDAFVAGANSKCL